MVVNCFTNSSLALSVVRELQLNKESKMLISEFLEYSEAAWDAVYRSDPRSPLRYGQALHWAIPQEFFAPIHQTDSDFYYWVNEHYEEINQICFELCEDYQK
jgi:hypothetical protein